MELNLNNSINENEQNKNEQNKINLKKIKYKLKNISYDEYIKNFTSGCHKQTINCSYDFLLSQYGKPYTVKTNQYDKIKASWYIKVKTSNNYEYYIDIYDWEQFDKKLEDITEWNIGGKVENCDYLDYVKLTKLINYQFTNYLNKKEKLKLKDQHINSTKIIKSTISASASISQSSSISKSTPVEYKQTKFIDEIKYKQLDNDKLTEFSNDDLACVLFTRFKSSGNFLMKEALIIHRALEDPINYNKSANDGEKKNNYKNNTLIDKDKSKYNNKKDKSKYNNKKNKTINNSNK